MARVTRYVDDLDGTEIGDNDGGPVLFALGDKRYRIDLNTKNAAKLEKALAPFIEVAAEVEDAPPAPTRGRGAAAGRKAKAGGGETDKDYLAAVRAWARENGHEVSDRGRVAQSIQDAYKAATGG